MAIDFIRNSVLCSAKYATEPKNPLTLNLIFASAFSQNYCQFDEKLVSNFV